MAEEVRLGANSLCLPDRFQINNEHKDRVRPCVRPRQRAALPSSIAPASKIWRCVNPRWLGNFTAMTIGPEKALQFTRSF